MVHSPHFHAVIPFAPGTAAVQCWSLSGQYLSYGTVPNIPSNFFLPGWLCYKCAGTKNVKRVVVDQFSFLFHGELHQMVTSMWDWNMYHVSWYAVWHLCTLCPILSTNFISGHPAYRYLTKRAAKGSEKKVRCSTQSVHVGMIDRDIFGWSRAVWVFHCNALIQ